jgi:HlyD family secretion protein
MTFRIYQLPAILLLGLSLTACNNNNTSFDATGTFEADEVIVSSEVAGRVLSFTVEEGQEIKKGTIIGYIDSTQLHLSKLQLQESRKAVLAGRPDTRTQIEATKKEIENAKIEKQRIENLVKGNVASPKQLDDINSKLAVLEARLAAQQNSLTTTTSTLNEQSNAIGIQLAMVEDQLKRCKLVNPINGTVLTKYVMENEMTMPGKALYKIADLSAVNLRAYVSGNQLPELKLGQQVEVLVDSADGEYKTYSGTVTWISDKAEFTPKTIQTKEERANLVYAVKISVKNDGFLKLGMYGEVNF